MNTCASPHNFKITVNSSEDHTPLGTITVRPGPVAPGRLAIVRVTPDGLPLTVRLFYYREGGREFVRLERFGPEGGANCYPLAAVKIEGEIVCFSRRGESCEECGNLQRPAQKPARARQRSARAMKAGVRREVDSMEWPEVISV